MRAVVVRTFAGPEALELVDVPVPEAGPGQVRVRVEAAGVNPVDAVTRAGVLAQAGLMPPREVVGIGWDVAGVVDRVGPGVAGFAPGERVIGLRDRLDAPLGSYAEYLVLDASVLAPAPAGVPAVEAATLPLNGLTAVQALDLLGLPAGATLLVTGAAGAVGGFAVELAVLRGLRVVALAGEEDEALVRELGAEWFVPRGTADPAAAVRSLVPGGVDGALDAALLGVVALGAVRNRGAFVAVSGGAPVGLRGIRVTNVWIAADGRALAGLSDLAARRRLTLRVADALPLEQAAEAHRRLDRGGLRGRLVLVP
ncbi:NADP-dependent oxidoreductase [Streptomyces sp. CB01881]|uniref:NADP-dependent oxidoreductase n=1 Tax=Streptomyces sp. CB01881 TaxID=2078691 RepID=UPI000CDC33C8|nr:NADP-dependent oxidoreductase [Streptomyces sp. CB01881]AUY48049.1 NADPH:quinone reductase [Streptomyces sp. CB01881]TYC76529.1 NADP-dependent oxidoreductase [Streptomyces sp. CB01881]